MNPLPYERSIYVWPLRLPPFSTSGSIPGIGNDAMRLQMTITVHAIKGSDIKVTGLVGGDSINKYSAHVTVVPLQ